MDRGEAVGRIEIAEGTVQRRKFSHTHFNKIHILLHTLQIKGSFAEGDTRVWFAKVTGKIVYLCRLGKKIPGKKKQNQDRMVYPAVAISLMGEMSYEYKHEYEYDEEADYDTIAKALADG